MRTVHDFWSRVEKGDDCWTWLGPRHKSKWPYGITRFRGRSVVAHRMAWMLTYGEIPKGKLVCHKCDNPPCVRPDHLFLGDAKSNMEDMAQKGRNRAAENVHAPKLSAEQVHTIRRKHGEGCGIRQLARDFNVVPTTIWFVVHKWRRKWI